MAEFTIHTIGNGEFLAEIFNTVAMITGTNSFSRAAGIGLLFGVLVVSFQSVIQGAKQFNIHIALVCFLMFSMFFGAPATVKIEDPLSGRVIPVDNVPIGVAAAGGIISSIGYGITELFETGYTLIDASTTKQPYNDALKKLNAVRNLGEDTRVFERIDAFIGGKNDFKKTLYNHVRECTLTRVDLGDLKVNEIYTMKAKDVLEFNSSLYYTEIHTAAGPMTVPCSNASVFISNVLTNGIESPQLDQHLRALLGVPAFNLDSGLQNIHQAMQLLGKSSTSAQDYVATSIIEPIYHQAAQGKYADMMDISSAMMVNQAIQQRNTQWAAQQSVFMSVAHPLMTFFEGFVYAITPMMGIIMCMGMLGIQLVGKYFTMLLWIQLWAPVLSVTNLYIHMAASGRLSQFVPHELDSFYALKSTTEIMQNYIATGGMLAAATPVISLFIITGSTYAFASLAGRLGGSEFIKPTTTTPNTVDNGPLMQTDAQRTNNAMTGTMMNGAAGLLGSINASSAMSSMVSSTQQQSRQATQQFQEQFSNAWNNAKNSSNSFAKMESLGSQLSTMNNETASHISSAAKDIQKRFGLSDRQTNALAGTWAAGVAAKADAGDVLSAISNFIPIGRLANIAGKAQAKVPALLGSTGLPNVPNFDQADNIKTGLELQGSAKASDTQNQTKDSAYTLADAFTKGYQYTSNQSANMANGIAYTAGTNKNSAWTENWGFTEGSQLMKSASDVKTSTDSYTDAKQLATQVGSGVSFQGKDLLGSFQNSPQSMEQMNAAFKAHSTASMREEANTLTNKFMHSYGIQEPQAKALAQAHSLLNARNYEGKDPTDGAEAAMRAISTATGFNLNTNSGNETGPVSPFANSAIAGNGHGDVQGKVENGMSHVDRAEVKSQTAPAANVASTPVSLPSKVETAAGEQIVKTAFNDNKDQLNRDASTGYRQFSNERESELLETIARKPAEVNTAAGLFGAVDQTAGYLSNAAEGFIKPVQDLIENPKAALSSVTSNAMEAGYRAIEKMNPVAQAKNVASAAMEFVSNGFGSNGSGPTQPPQDLQQMSLNNQIGFWAVASQTAAELGVTDQFMAQNRDNIRETMTRQGLDQNLTPGQAAVFASGFVIGGGRDTDNKNEAALEMYRQELAANDPHSLILNGKAHLSKEAQNEFDTIVPHLQAASGAGKYASTYLNEIKALNNHREGLDVKN